MSQDDLTPYYQSGETGVEHRNVDAAGNDHPFGDEARPFQADLRPLIRQVADDLYDSWRATVREYLANAETACLKVERFLEDPSSTPFDDMIVDDSYEPIIEVTWDRSEKKLTIQDNGIGMAAAEVDQVFRHIGRSAARDLGTMSGAFGMGSLSFSKFIGHDNMMIMVSHSRLNDDNASYIVTLAGVEPVRGMLDQNEYGTKFTLDQKEDDMEIREAVRKYAESMRVKVLYTEYDENGKEVFNEDWGDKRLFDDYTQGVYADSIEVEGGFKAYMSPDASNRTLLLSMEIERESSVSYNSRYPIDVRLLDESGKVIESDNGNEGLMPVNRMEYEQMLVEARSDCITESLLSNQDVTAQVGEVDGGEVYHISEELLASDEPLPRANYVTDLEKLDTYGPKRVILGPHEGRVVVSEDEWNKMPQGRAENFVPEDELEEYDVDSGAGDLCLPQPTTDRSSLQKHPTFWEYLAKRFNKEFDSSIDDWRKELEKSADEMKAIREMNAQTVENIKKNA